MLFEMPLSKDSVNCLFRVTGGDSAIFFDLLMGSTSRAFVSALSWSLFELQSSFNISNERIAPIEMVLLIEGFSSRFCRTDGALKVVVAFDEVMLQGKLASARSPSIFELFGSNKFGLIL